MKYLCLKLGVAKQLLGYTIINLVLILAIKNVHIACQAVQKKMISVVLPIPYWLKVFYPHCKMKIN